MCVMACARAKVSPIHSSLNPRLRCSLTCAQHDAIYYCNMPLVLDYCVIRASAALAAPTPLRATYDIILSDHSCAQHCMLLV